MRHARRKIPREASSYPNSCRSAEAITLSESRIVEMACEAHLVRGLPIFKRPLSINAFLVIANPSSMSRKGLGPTVMDTCNTTDVDVD